MGKSSTVKPVQCFLCKGRQLQGTCEWFADPGWTPEGGLFELSWLSGSGSRWPTWQIWLEGWCFPWNPRGCSRKPPSESVSSRSWRSWHWDGLCSNTWPIESPGLQPTGFFLRKKWARVEKQKLTRPRRPRQLWNVVLSNSFIDLKPNLWVQLSGEPKIS